MFGLIVDIKNLFVLMAFNEHSIIINNLLLRPIIIAFIPPELAIIMLSYLIL
jgi:hypothetical protein